MDEPVDLPPGTDLRRYAMHLLTRLPAPARMDAEEAAAIVEVMRPVHLVAETLVFREGDADDNDYMVLVLDGQLRVASHTGAGADELVISVLGAGSLVGEMGVVDDGPRSATCTTLTDVKLAVLSRAALLGLLQTHPAAAARLVLNLSRGLAERLREGNRRLRMLSQVTRAMQAELDAAHAVNRRLLERGRSVPHAGG